MYVLRPRRTGDKSSVKILSPLINTDGNRWTHTCPNCHWVPDKIPIIAGSEIHWIWPDPDYVTTHRISPRTGEFGKRALNLPDRCKPCAAKYRRRLRMRKRVAKLVELIDDLPGQYRQPKLLTFALPTRRTGSIETYATDREDMIEILKSRYRKGLKYLRSQYNIIGGISVIECTTRLPSLDNYPDGFMSLKHHPHVHMVALCPYIHHTKFKEFTQCLRQFGLGSIDVEIINVRSFDGETNYSGIKRISSYITKYLTKDRQPCSVFGVLRSGSA